MLGTPCNKTWPGVTGLPYWSDEFPYFGRRALGDELRLDEDIVNLLEPMLQCNPLDRLAASILLTHPVFQNLDKTPIVPNVMSVTPEVLHPELQGDVFPTEQNFEMQSMQTMLEDRSPTRSTGKTQGPQGLQGPQGPEGLKMTKGFPVHPVRFLVKNHGAKSASNQLQHLNVRRIFKIPCHSLKSGLAAHSHLPFDFNLFIVVVLV